MSDNERAAKRQKRSMPELAIDTTSTPAPDMIVDVCNEGDTILVVKGIAGVPKPVGIRVSSSALSITSPVFRRLLATPGGNAPPTPPTGVEEPRLVYLENDDGDALFLLLNILHLRNDALPARLRPDLLFRFVAICARYECTVAAGRAASQWLDYIYTKTLKASRLFSHTGPSATPATPASAFPPTTPFSAFPPTNDSQTLFKLIEASLTLNDALFFARFTSHFILTQPTITSISEIAPSQTQTQQRLAAVLQARQKQTLQDLRIDLDLLIDPLSEALSEDTKHYPDCAPGDEAQPDGTTTAEEGDNQQQQYCPIDRDAATEFLSALRDANLWPATRWPALTPPQPPSSSFPSTSTSTAAAVGSPSLSSLPTAIVSTLKSFRVPDHDASDACYWCMHVEDRFATALNLVRAMHKDRLWGLCLDCYKAGGTGMGMGVYKGECRYEHFKPGVGKVWQVDVDVDVNGVRDVVKGGDGGDGAGEGEGQGSGGAMAISSTEG
ncbi:hypothetical protein Slin15195_G086350 [Septoria linicola]|uniref:BTB domain-containing protein n=1 Tax=Septoria linicola TaxID=215465 RepID=A0A9Q9B2T7_9PEZI|nr:hypothetical protein Slin14017_G088940 [Septoria linicola]USW55316.1 hypothetical protein Slin15195_G086350 [Septoria linicola]